MYVCNNIHILLPGAMQELERNILYNLFICINNLYLYVCMYVCMYVIIYTFICI
jgi:hypothetical protein